MSEERMGVVEYGSFDKGIRDKKRPVPVPLPTFSAAEFIAWLVKRGYTRTRSKCERKCEQIGIDLKKDILDIYAPDKIMLYRLSGGEILIMVKDRSWAQQVTDHYELTLPHHSNPMNLHEKGQ